MIAKMNSLQENASKSLPFHASNRLMYGPKTGDIQRIESMGYESFLEEQLHPENIDDTLAETIFSTIPQDTLSEDWDVLYDRRSTSPYSEVLRPFYEVRHLTWARMVHSQKQLYERMVNFWHDHFNIYGSYYLIRNLFPKWDQTIRNHALGNFRVFLEATAKHPCMLRYLDNYKSTDGGPNENYARELIELHTLGAMNYNTPDGYRDDDVYEASRCLTGWSYDRDNESPSRGQFQYNHGDHDRYQKYFLGTQIPRDQSPLQDGLDVLDLLAFHPGTARHIAWKLCVRFISETPPSSIIDSTARKFFDEQNSPDQIRSTLDHVLRSTEFKQSWAAKFKRPQDWMVSFMRSLDIPYIVNDKFNMNSLYDSMGQPFFGWVAPDGAPDESNYWATSNNFIHRWRLAFKVSDNNYSKYGFAINTDGIMPDSIRTPREIAQFWAERILAGPVLESTLNSLVDFLAEGRNPDLPLSRETIDAKVRHVAALCTVTPEFMRR